MHLPQAFYSMAFAHLQFLRHQISSSHLRYLIFFLARHLSQPGCVSFLRYDKRETSLKIFSYSMTFAVVDYETKAVLIQCPKRRSSLVFS
jgi:hypothetical protein